MVCELGCEFGFVVLFGDRLVNNWYYCLMFIVDGIEVIELFWFFLFVLIIVYYWVFGGWLC